MLLSAPSVTVTMIVSRKTKPVSVVPFKTNSKSRFMSLSAGISKSGGEINEKVTLGLTGPGTGAITLNKA